MAKLTIISVSEPRLIESIQKSVKTVEVNKEGLEWNFNRVTVWEDHPAYDVLHEGMELTKSYIQETDQDKINEKTGKPYKNYTLRDGEEPARTTSAPSNGNLEAKIDAIYAVLKEIHVHLLGEKPTANQTAYEQSTGRTYPEVTDEELDDVSNIPF